jgi:hypothetical protein
MWKSRTPMPSVVLRPTSRTTPPTTGDMRRDSGTALSARPPRFPFRPDASASEIALRTLARDEVRASGQSGRARLHPREFGSRGSRPRDASSSSTPPVCAAPIRARSGDWPSGAAGSGGQQGGGREDSGRRAVIGAVACRAKTQSVARGLGSAAWPRDRFNAPRRFAQDGHPPGLAEREATRACHSRPQ